MATPPIRISISASADESVDRVFATIEKRAKRLGGNIGKSVKQGTQEAGEGATELGEKWNETATGMGARTKRFRDDQVEAWRQIGKVAEQEMNRAARAQARAGRQFAERTSHRTTRFLMPNAPLGSFAARAGRDLLRGAGVDLDIGQSIARNVELERSATALSNQAYQEGAPGAAGRRQDPRALINEARSVTAATSIGPQEVVGGLTKYTALTGKLDEARALAKDLGGLAAATNSNFEDMAAAAAEVSNHLGDIPDKGKAIMHVMQTITGEGKLGSLEVKDMARQMAKLAAPARLIQGDAGQNIAKLGALAQFSKLEGGATSASQAATSVARFVDAMFTPARSKAFKKAGIETMSGGLARDPFAVIKDALVKTGSDPSKFYGLFSSSIGRKPAQALYSTYVQNGRGQTGMDAVQKQLDKFMHAFVSQKDISESVARQNDTTAARVARFQAKLDETTDVLRSKLLPSLDAAAPKFFQLVDGLTSLTGWLADNPWKGAVAAAGVGITASFARAGLESTLRAGIERMLLGKVGGGILGAGGNAGALGAATGTLGAGLLIASLAVTTLVVGTAVIDHFIEKEADRERGNVKDKTDAQNIESKLRAGKLTPAEATDLATQKKAQDEKNLAHLQEQKGGVGGFARSLMDFESRFLPSFLGGDDTAIKNRQKSEATEEKRSKDELQESNRILGRLHELLSSGIPVHVTSLPEVVVPGRVPQ